jgi:hypothetical protein
MWLKSIDLASLLHLRIKVKLQQVICQDRIGATTGCSHDLPDKEAE